MGRRAFSAAGKWDCEAGQGTEPTPSRGAGLHASTASRTKAQRASPTPRSQVARLMREPDAIVPIGGKPLAVVSDNGNALAAIFILRWPQERPVEWPAIALGKPPSALVESFNGMSASTRRCTPQCCHSVGHWSSAHRTPHPSHRSRTPATGDEAAACADQLDQLSTGGKRLWYAPRISTAGMRVHQAGPLAIPRMRRRIG